MEALKAELARKRKATEELRRTNDGLGGEINSSKFIRQGEYQSLLERQHEEAQRKLNEERQQKEDAKLAKGVASASHAVPVEVAVSVPLNVNLHADVENSTGHPLSNPQQITLTIDGVKQRLRELGQPVTIFGENAAERRERLEDFATSLLVTDDERAGEGADDGNSDSGSDDGVAGGNEENELKVKKDSTSKVKSATLSSEGVLFSRVPNLPKEKAVYKYFRSLIKLWEYDLSARDSAVMATTQGKLETKAHKQCKDHIRPMLKMCKKKTLPSDILEKLFDMVKCCEDGNFRVAHDHYYMAAIGNAAWPIGVTSVGIHERSSRERINSQKVAHVMNNELQRKYLTSVKRLLTFAQTKRPDVPPSMKVT